MKLNWDYLAGFTDADGYIGVVGRGPRVTWGQKDKEQTEAIVGFLRKKELHPTTHQTRANFYMINLGRRDEVQSVLEILGPKMVLKAAACNRVLKWINDHPSKANRQSIDEITLGKLAEEDYTITRMAEILKCSTQKVSKYAKSYGISFLTNGRIVKGKRVPKFTKEETLKRKRERSLVSRCPDCGIPIYFQSKRCRKCYDKDRPKRGGPSFVLVPCATCGKSVRKLKGQLKYFPLSFCNRSCSSRYKAEGWSKKFSACIECGMIEKPHRSGGRCEKCYNRWYKRKGKAA